MRWYDWPGPGPGTDMEEQAVSLYGGWILTDSLVLSGEATWSSADGAGLASFDRIDTISVPVRLSWFDSSGLFASVGGAFVHQDYTPVGGGGGDDSVALVDVSAGYRLPNGRGIASVQVLNLFDQSFDYQERTFSPLSLSPPTYARELTVIGRLTLSF